MYIKLHQLSKRYGYQWVLKDINYELTTNNIYGISGRNGSGKSTLIKLLSGHLTASEGSIQYLQEGQIIPPSKFYSFFSWVGPYTELIQEFTVEEMFHFHLNFKKFSTNITFSQFLDILGWQKNTNKQIRFLSSGMNQKLQLAFAFLSHCEVVLLDEPTSYLDEMAKKWFEQILNDNKKEKLIVISSNDKFDLQLCDTIISLDK
ncbi:MAG: ABC transporter ATP-binding protein [Saprospiraceae bacterium]